MIAISIVAICVSAAVFFWTVYWSYRSEKRHARERWEDQELRREERREDRQERRLAALRQRTAHPYIVRDPERDK